MKVSPLPSEGEDADHPPPSNSEEENLEVQEGTESEEEGKAWSEVAQNFLGQRQAAPL